MSSVIVICLCIPIVPNSSEEFVVPMIADEDTVDHIFKNPSNMVEVMFVLMVLLLVLIVVHSDPCHPCRGCHGRKKHNVNKIT